MGYSVLMTKD